MRAQVTRAGGRRTAVAVIGLLSVLAAGCSSSASPASPPASPEQAIRLAAATAESVNSFTATISARLTSTGPAAGTEAATLAGTVTEQVHPSLLGKLDFSTLTAAGQSLPGGVSEILTSREIYIKLALFRQLLRTSKPWIGLPLSAVSARSGLNLNSLFAQQDTSSPLAQAQLLAGAKNVRAVGTGTVAGVPVTEYSGSYSLATALDRLPASLRGSLSKAFKQAGVSSGTASFLVWIDGRHLVRKEIATLKTSTLTEFFTTTVTSVNQPVTVTAPPASQVYTVSPAQLGSPGSSGPAGS